MSKPVDRPLDVAEAHDTVRMQGDQHERRPFVAQSAQTKTAF